MLVLSGGLTGCYGSLNGTPVFLDCGDVDDHIPVERVHRAAGIFESLGANVEKRIYLGMGHTINPEAMDVVKDAQQAILKP